MWPTIKNVITFFLGVAVIVDSLVEKNTATVGKLIVGLLLIGIPSIEDLLRIAKRKGLLMPYEIRPVDGNGYEVINSDTKDVKGKHETKEDAERQVRLLHAIENDPSWEAEDKHDA